jgi:hypothetical protein
LVVTGWLVAAGFAFVYWFWMNRGQATQETKALVYKISFVFFDPTPVFFAVLCWNNISWPVMRLLWKQTQFKVVIGLAFHVMAMDAWRGIERGWFDLQPMNPLTAVCASILRWSPLFMILFLDSLRIQSRLFRIALPAAYLAYVVATYGLFGYVLPPEVIFKTTNTSLAGEGTSQTFQGQISGSLASLALLMTSFLTNAMNDDSAGQAVLFPVKFATMMKSTVDRVLSEGWMKTGIDSRTQQVVLMSTAGSGADVTQGTEGGGSVALTIQA